METRKIALGSILITVAVLICLFYTVRLVMLVLAIGVGVGVLLIPVVDKARKKGHLPASVTAFLVILGMLAVLGAVGYSIYYIASNQFGKMIADLPQTYDVVRHWLFQHAGLKLGSGKSGFNVATAVQGTLGTIVQGAKLGFEVAAGLFYVVSVALYVAVDPARNQDSFLTLFPAHMRSRVTDLMHQSATTLRQWFVSHLIVVVFMGAAYALGLWLIGNPYWMLFGALAAVLEFVPYIGPFTIAVGASLVALTNGKPMSVLWVILLDLVLQELEGHVLLPIVMKERIDLPPVQLITLAIVMGLWFGILGVFATPPLLAVLRTIYLATYAKSMDARKTPPPEPKRFLGIAG